MVFGFPIFFGPWLEAVRPKILTGAFHLKLQGMNEYKKNRALYSKIFSG